MSTVIKYAGKHRNGVYVGNDQFCAYGGQVEVADDVAESLLEQGGWEVVKPKSTPKADKADPTPESEA